MISNTTKTLISLVVILVGFVAVFGLSNFIEENKPNLSEKYMDEDLSLQGEKLKGWSLGFEGLLADWYWVRSLQYIGYKVQNTEGTLNIDNLEALDPRLLYPLLDNATTLDPKYDAAYSYGAIVLPAINPKQAIKLTEKGIRNNPDNWRLYQHLGYIHWRLKDYKKAAETYKKGSEVKDAPEFMKLMAAKMTGDGGSRETARQIYQQMLDEADDSNTKSNAEIRLAQLDALDEIDTLNKTLRDFKAKNQRCANSLNEIFPLLQNIKLSGNKDFRIDNKINKLVDPTNVPYLLNKEKCIVTLDAKNTKIPLN